MSIGIACLAINARTLKDALRTHRIIIRSGLNHGNQIWSQTNVRNKGCFVAVQLLILSMGIDRLILLLSHYHPDLPVRWVAFGGCRTLIGMLIALTAWLNARALRKLAAE